MVCSARLRISSKDKGEAPEILAFSNFKHTLNKGPITDKVPITDKEPITDRALF